MSSSIMFSDPQLHIRVVLMVGLEFYISPYFQITWETMPPYFSELSTQFEDLGVEVPKQHCKVLQYNVEISKTSKNLSTCITFYANVSQSKISGETLSLRGYTHMTDNNALTHKIRNKDYACLEFLGQEGDDIAVYEKC